MLKIIKVNEKFIAINTTAIRTIIPHPDTIDAGCTIEMLDGKKLNIRLSFEELIALLTGTDMVHIEAEKTIAERMDNEHQKAIDKWHEQLKRTNYEGLELQDLELSCQAYSLLKRAGYNTIQELSNLTFEEIDSIRMFTPKLTMEVINALKKFGIEIK